MEHDHHRTTIEDDLLTSTSDANAFGTVPGLVVIFSGESPAWRTHRLEGKQVTLGRGALPDARASRDHAELTRDERGGWSVRDLDSRNGTFLDGVPVRDAIPVKPGQVLRLGHTIALVVADVRKYEAGGVETDGGMVAGPATRELLRTIARFGEASRTLLIQGESGSGKELAAKAFHRAGPAAKGPFLAVNCAAIPEGLAERLMFGARKGAYSGADKDAEGYVQAADGGVLFLDEVGELDLVVQAKLLRAVETQEVLALGAASPRKVDVRFVMATHRHLREAVATGRFRADLFYRIGQPDVRLPPLRDRREEIPFLLTRELASVDGNLVPHAKLVEHCLLRSWPGNVRELLASARTAAQRALADGHEVVRSRHLADEAGRSFQPPASSPRTPERASPPNQEEIVRALNAQNGNIAAAARSLGVHRTQLYRLMRRYGIGTSQSSSDSNTGT